MWLTGTRHSLAARALNITPVLRNVTQTRACTSAGTLPTSLPSQVTNWPLRKEPAKNTPGNRVDPYRCQARKAVAPTGARGICRACADTVQCSAARHRYSLPILSSRPCCASSRALSSEGCTAVTRNIALCGSPIQMAGRRRAHSGASPLALPAMQGPCASLPAETDLRSSCGIALDVHLPRMHTSMCLCFIAAKYRNWFAHRCLELAALRCKLQGLSHWGALPSWQRCGALRWSGRVRTPVAKFLQIEHAKYHLCNSWSR